MSIPVSSHVHVLFVFVHVTDNIVINLILFGAELVFEIIRPSAGRILFTKSAPYVHCAHVAVQHSNQTDIAARIACTHKNNVHAPVSRVRVVYTTRYFQQRNYTSAVVGMRPWRLPRRRRDNEVFIGRDGPRLLVVGGGVGGALSKDGENKRTVKKSFLYRNERGRMRSRRKVSLGGPGAPEVLLRDVTGHEIRHHVTGSSLWLL